MLIAAHFLRVHFSSFRVGVVLLLGVACANAAYSATDVVHFRVQVVDEAGVAIESAFLRANQQRVDVNEQGVLDARVPRSRRYQLTLSAPGYYTMLHTFSEQERLSFAGKFPSVTLVRQVEGRVLLAFGGDAMLGRRYHEPNPGDPRALGPGSRLEDSKALLRWVRPYLTLADYSSINLETPVVAAQPEQASEKNVTFFSYPETLPALHWAGVDHVSLGNNHTYDYLRPALKETLDRMAASGMAYSGAGLDESQALEPHRTRIQGSDYSFFGYVGWPGKVVPSQVAQGSGKGGAALGTADNIVGALSAEDNSRVSVVEYHGSDEYSFQPTATTRERLRAAIDNGAELVIGHHPHVLHGLEIYKGKLIAYSLGNFLFDQYIYETQRSALLYVWMDGNTFHRAEIVPLYIKAYRPTPAMGRMRDYILRRVAQQSRLEGVELSLSGGHAVVGATTPALPPQQTLKKVHSSASEKLISLTDWRQSFEHIVFHKDAVSYRMGRDWWALGDNEQEDQFQLVDRSWNYTTVSSGISKEEAQENYSMKLSLSKNTHAASAGQKYFMRVWDAQPKSIALEVYAERDATIQPCLELRERAMSTAQARLKPRVHCLTAARVEAGKWRQLVFDFEPPSRTEYRGMRVRFDVISSHANDHAVYLDNIKFISWEKTGRSSRGQMLPLSGNRRWDVIAISSAEAGQDCCEISISN